MRVSPRKFVITLVILGIASVICLSPIGSVLAIIAAISIIGLPITLMMAAIPPVFVFLLLARLIHLVLSKVSLQFWPASAALALGLLAAVPYYENRRLEAIAHSLTSGDSKDVGVLPAVGALAYITPSGSQQGACNDFCQRALLNGAVSRFIAARLDQPGQTPADSLPGTLFELQPRPVCPPFDLNDGVGNLEIAGEDRKWGDKTPADLLRLKAAQGICLIERDATVAEADAALFDGSVKKGKTPFSAGLSMNADTVSAYRLSYYVRDSGKLVQRYRATGVTYHKLLPLLAPSCVGGYGLELVPGFLRGEAYLGDAQQYRQAPAIEPFLKDVLHFDLALRDADGMQATRDAIASALDGDGSIDRANIKVMQDFFETIGRRKDTEKPDALLALRVLQDRRVPIPRGVAAPVRKFAQDDPDLARQFAAALFGRLFEIESDEREDDPSYLGYPLGYLSGAIEALPDAAILPYREDLQRLARDPKARIRAYVALKKLSAFGADAVPTLIYLIDDASNYKSSENFGDNAWQHPYLAGIQGFCRMGPAGKAAIPLLYERLDSGVVVKFASYWDMTINTLVSLGANADEMWPHLQTQDKNHTRERFDNEVRRAGRRIDCSY